MSHRMHLAVRVMLYGSDVEEAETTIPILAFSDRSIPEVGWSSGIFLDQPVALDYILQVP